MTPPVVNVQVDVVATDEGSSIQYRLAPGNDHARAYVTGPQELTFPEGESLYKVHFHIDDKNCSYNLKFKRSMPICAADGACCPTSGGIKTKQLRADGAPLDRKISIENANSAAGPVGFALFFKDQQSGADLEPFDPIMQNGGGGSALR
jgi:hypothetical protein